jgi:hypothetical protein
MQIGKHLILKQRAKPYVSADRFENHVRTVFLAHLAITHIMQNVLNEEAVRLMDNCSPQLTPVVIDLLSEGLARIVTFAPHTTQIFQALDLTSFGVLKRRGQYQFPFADDAGRAGVIKKLCRDFQSTVTDIHLWGAFRWIGLIYHIVDGIQRVSFDEIILRESAGLKSLWNMILIPRWRICRRGAKM